MYSPLRHCYAWVWGNRGQSYLLANALHNRGVDASKLMGLPSLLAAQGRAKFALLWEGRVEICCIGGGEGAQPAIAQHQVAARRLG